MQKNLQLKNQAHFFNKNRKMKILVVGAGLSGAVVSRELAEAGCKVTIIDKRNHIAGNTFDYTNEHGIRVHKYGPHLFHTQNENVFNYLSRFTEWVSYYHKVKAQLEDGRYVTLPVNKETKEIVGEENILDVFFRPYTKKMWGKEIEELDPGIVNRVKQFTRDDMNELYFPDDKFQCIPKNGYTKMVENMIDHENIQLELNTSFDKMMEDEYSYIFNSMPIDEYYNFCYGELPYRSIKFHTIDIPAPKILPATTVNFTHTGKFTRITEWKNIPEHGQNSSMTTLTYEEPCDYADNDNERYYPVKDIEGENRKLFSQYSAIENPKTIFMGRLGLYVYIDMHQCISSTLSIVKKFIKEKNV